MAAITSAQSGNWSAAETWIGGVVPGPGDTATIATGHVVTVDADVTLGSNTASVGHAITINASSSSAFGTLRLATGASLTLRGTDTTTNTLMLVNRHARFEPQPGSTILGDVASDYASVILNNGIISAFGTPIHKITFTTPTPNINWNTQVTNQALPLSSYIYDPENQIAVANLAAVTGGGSWIANSTGTGPGSPADTSVGFGGPGAAQFTSEKTSIAQITQAGDYCIDYDTGVVWFFHGYSGPPTPCTVSYRYLSGIRGWGIWTTSGVSGSSLRIDHCIFRYFGPGASLGANSYGLRCQGLGGPNKEFQLTNSTIQHCTRFLLLNSTVGSEGSEIQISGNTIHHCRTTATTGQAAFLDTKHATMPAFLTVANNDLNLNESFLRATITGAVASWPNLRITNNTGRVAILFEANPTVTCPGGVIENNTLAGFGALSLSNTASLIARFAGTGPDHRAVIRNNAFRFHGRCVALGNFLDIHGNSLFKSALRDICGPTTNDRHVHDIRIFNNLVYGRGGGDAGIATPAFAAGFPGFRAWVDKLWIAHNTVANRGGSGGGFLDLGDSASGGQTLVTRLAAANNLCWQGNASGPTRYALRRPADNGSTTLCRAHVAAIDHNLDHGCSARYDGYQRQGTFVRGGTNYNTQAAEARNIPGLALFDPGFANCSNKTVSLTIASATDQTLLWDGGDPVQLTLDSGTATAAAQVTTNGVAGLLSGTLTDSTKNWPTALNHPGCPRLHWVRITGGTGAGQVRAIVNNTATVLTVAPAWTIVPDPSSTYAIIRSEVSLAGAVGTVKAGIYLPELPTAPGTYADSDISFADHSISANPLLVSSNGPDPSHYAIAPHGPAANAATPEFALAVDFFGNPRPRGWGYDIGFFEAPASSTSRMLLRMSGGFFDLAGGF